MASDSGRHDAVVVGRRPVQRLVVVAGLLQGLLSLVWWDLGDSDADSASLRVLALLVPLSGPAAMFIHGQMVWLVYLLMQAVEAALLACAYASRRVLQQRVLLVGGTCWWLLCGVLAVVVAV